MENVDVLEKTNITIPRYVELIGYDIALYRGWTE
jgi:hypothetical protein